MKPTTGRPKGGANLTAQRAMRRLRTVARHFLGDRGANVLITFALTLPVVLALVGAGIDYSYAEGSKTNLQDASDAAALAVAAEVVKNPNDTKTTLQALAQNVLNANYNGTPDPTITDFHVCAPVTPTDCTAASGSIAMDTVAIAESVNAPCTLAAIVPTICSGNPPGQTVRATTQTVIGFGATLQLNIVMDTSASMIVGSTAADVTTMSNWAIQKTTITEKCTKGANGGSSVTQSCYHWGNWNQVHPDAVVADYAVTGGAPCYGTYPSCTSQDNPPCAFLCHDNGDPGTTNADAAAGLTDAHTATATTRFDVMIQAAKDLISNIETQLNSSASLAKNTYLFNIYGFNTSITKYGSTNTPCTKSGSTWSCTAATTAINSVSPGLDTYINNAMTTFAGSGTNSIGSNGTGASSTSPLKFMILVTDGLQSDRNLNWQNCTSWGTYTPWSFSNACLAGMFDTPLSTASCTTLKNNGVVLAVLETPYVPLTGQDPDNTPYEGTVRDVIYPGGPTGASTLSAALQSCATSGYYFQATSSSDIATGFTTLTNKFIQQHAYLSK